MKAKTKLTKLWSFLLALVMLVGLLPATALAEEPDAALQFADAPGEYFYNISGDYNSEGPTVNTTFTLTEPTMITGIWTYHWNAGNYDIDFSRQTIQLKDTNTNTLVYSGAVRVGHIWNVRNCDWIVLPNIILPAGTYQVIDSHHESWCALNNKGVCMIKGYSITPSATADFSADPTAALALLNAAKTGAKNSTWDNGTKTLTLNGVNFTSTASTALKLPKDATIVLANGTTNTIEGGNSTSGNCYGIYTIGNLTIKGGGKLNVTGGRATVGDSNGIVVYSNLSITDGTITAKGGTAHNGSYGIVTGKSVSISGNAMVTSTAGSACYWSNGINSSNNVTISGSASVTAQGNTVTAAGDAEFYGSYGISVKNDLSVSGTAWVSATGSNITGINDPAQVDSFGLFVGNNTTISGTSQVTAKGDRDSMWNLNGSLRVDGYTITFNSNGSTGYMKAVTGGITAYTLPANGFEAPSGKKFKGWATSAKGAVIASRAIIVSADTTLYAIWESNQKPTIEKPTIEKPTIKKSTIKKLSEGKKSFKITWKKVKGVSGYQVQYSTSKKFAKKTSKIITCKGNKKFTKTVKKLKSGKKYYVRIRGYKIVGTKKSYSKWSAAKLSKRIK